MSAPEEKNVCLVENDFKQMIDMAVKNLPTQPQEGDLQRCIFDTRQSLVQKIQGKYAPVIEEGLTDLAAEAKALEYEQMWRSMLPPLLLPTVRKITQFSAWRSAVIAILGLLLGTGFGQALLGIGLISTPQTPHYQSAGLVVLCALMGAMGVLWLAEYLVQAKNSGVLRVFTKKYRWKRFARFCNLTFAIVLVLAVVRDFFGGKVFFLHLVQSFGVFLHEGHTVAFFSNIYGILIFCFIFSMLLKRPLSFDHQDFEDKLQTAVRQWWAGASCIGQLLQENLELKKDNRKAAWHKVGIDLYSLAGELPEARKDWLETRLRRVGIEATREEGVLIWEPELEDRYTMLGHIAVGDACYVDEPPVFEEGLLVRKGTVRKVRK